MKFCIVIPVYKENPTTQEKGALIQCLSVFKSSSIYIITPEGLDLTNYTLQTNHYIHIKHLHPLFFKGIEQYNRLLLSSFFYNQFISYDYILIYQLDAYVFRDELDMWISKGYSYIGAPWFKDFDKSESSEMLWAVGNGGLSLRRVNDFLDVFNYKGKVFSFQFLWKKYRSYPFWKKCLRFPKVVIQYYFKNDTAHLYDLFGENEDHFWSFHASKLNPNFKIAPIEDALAFAFECNPQKMFELNHQQLPFGVHAWEKYDKPFWDNYMQAKDK